MLQNLFVYGTLMSHAGHPMGARLARESRLIGHGMLPGKLLDLGSYPALVEPGAGGELVYGEVRALNTPATSLRWLDDYERVIPGREAQSDYARLTRMVRLEAGGEVEAWVYVFQARLVRPSFIADGHWRGPRS